MNRSSEIGGLQQPVQLSMTRDSQVHMNHFRYVHESPQAGCRQSSLVCFDQRQFRTRSPQSFVLDVRYRGQFQTLHRAMAVPHSAWMLISIVHLHEMFNSEAEVRPAELERCEVEISSWLHNVSRRYARSR